MKKAFILFLSLLTTVSFAATGTGHEDKKDQEESSIQWITIEEAIEIAASGENDKLFFIDVYTDWCGWCKRMDATTFVDPEVVKVMNENFYAVKFDGEASREIEFRGMKFKFVAQGRKGYHQLAAALLQATPPLLVMQFLFFNVSKSGKKHLAQFEITLATDALDQLQKLFSLMIQCSKKHLTQSLPAI